MKGFILLVEDNIQITRGNERMLSRKGYETAAALTLAEAHAAIEKRIPDVIVLDIMMPDGSGLDFMRELRRRSNIPVLLLSGLATSSDIMHGLNDGGDDYLTKPYDFGVLLARIEALLRRAAQLPETLTRGTLQLDILAYQAFLNGKNLLLTKKEFSLLFLLVKNEKQALSSDYIYETIWRTPMAADDNALKFQLSRLRKKLGDAFSILYDANEDGYVFESLLL